MQYLKKMSGIFAAMNLAGLGIAIFLQTQLGADPIGIACEGISKSFGIMFGTASMIYNVVFIGIALLVARKNVGIGTVIYALTSGYFIDLYGMLIRPLGLGNGGLWVRIVGYVVGICFFTLGLAVLIQFEFGMNAVDAITYAVWERTHIPYRYLRTSIDVIQVLFGILLEGTFGIGTIVCACITGTVVNLFVGLLGKGKCSHSKELDVNMQIEKA